MPVTMAARDGRAQPRAMGARGQGAGETLAIDVALIRQREALGRELRPKVREALPQRPAKAGHLQGQRHRAPPGTRGRRRCPRGGKAMAGSYHPAHARTLGRRQPTLHRLFGGQRSQLGFGKLLGPGPVLPGHYQAPPRAAMGQASTISSASFSIQSQS